MPRTTDPYIACAEFRDLDGWLYSMFPGYDSESYPWCLDQVSGQEESCCRFYTLHPPMLLLIRATLHVSVDAASLEIVPASEPYKWPNEWHGLFGARDVSLSIAKSFLESSEELRIWEEGCLADTTDGTWYAIVVAQDGKDNCIVIANPECSPDPRWRALVNLFSDTFLNGAFTWDPGQNVPGPRSLYRHPAIADRYR